MMKNRTTQSSMNPSTSGSKFHRMMMCLVVRQVGQNVLASILESLSAVAAYCCCPSRSVSSGEPMERMIRSSSPDAAANEVWTDLESHDGEGACPSIPPTLLARPEAKQSKWGWN